MSSEKENLLLAQPDLRAIIEGSYITSVDGRSDSPVLGPSRNFNGILMFDVAALTASTYGVKASTNLMEWKVVLSTNAAADNFIFRDSEMTRFARRFFRVFKTR